MNQWFQPLSLPFPPFLTFCSFGQLRIWPPSHDLMSFVLYSAFLKRYHERQYVGKLMTEDIWCPAGLVLGIYGSNRGFSHVWKRWPCKFPRVVWRGHDCIFLGKSDPEIASCWRLLWRVLCKSKDSFHRSAVDIREEEMWSLLGDIPL